MAVCTPHLVGQIVQDVGKAELHGMVSGADVEWHDVRMGVRSQVARQKFKTATDCIQAVSKLWNGLFLFDYEQLGKGGLGSGRVVVCKIVVRALPYMRGKCYLRWYTLLLLKFSFKSIA